MLACDVIVTQGDVMYFSYVVGSEGFESRKSLSVACVAFFISVYAKYRKNNAKKQQQQQKDLREYNQV